MTPGAKARVARFNHLMTLAREIASIDAHSLSSLARIVAKPLQARRLTAVLTHATHGLDIPEAFDCTDLHTRTPVTPDGRTMSDLVLGMQGRTRSSGQAYWLNLGRDVLVPTPWMDSRIVNAIATIGGGKSQGIWEADNNHQVELLLPFGLGIVYGGNHSIAAGIADGQGRVRTKGIQDFTPSYEFVEYDGLSFKRKYDGLTLSRPVDEEIGQLYEIGRLMVELDSPYDAEPATDNNEQSSSRHDRWAVLYQVWVNGKDTGADLTGSGVHLMLKRARLIEGSTQWDAAFYAQEPVDLSVRGKVDSYVFKPVFPRRRLDDLRYL
jgi:hypothetical protein